MPQVRCNPPGVLLCPGYARLFSVLTVKAIVLFFGLAIAKKVIFVMIMVILVLVLILVGVKIVFLQEVLKCAQTLAQ